MQSKACRACGKRGHMSPSCTMPKNKLNSKHCNSKHSACFAFSEEEYGQNGCLEGDIEKQGLIFEDFFSLFWNEKKPFIKQDFTGVVNMQEFSKKIVDNIRGPSRVNGNHL